MANKSNSLHVVMFPWLAFGHLIPYLELSKFIAQRGHKVSFVSTPKNIDRLPKIPPNLASSITLVKIPLPRVEGLPENVEATVDLGTHDVALLKKAHDGLEPELTRFLENSAPDWIICDFAPYWLPPIATRLNISTSFFCILSASTIVFFGPSSDALINGTDPRTKLEDFVVPPEWIPFESKVAYKLFESKWILGATNRDGSGVSDMHRVGSVMKGSDVIFVRHCREFEGQWLELLEELQQRPVVPLGLMPPQVEETGLESNESWVAIKGWLDGQAKGSVVYVAFGSETSLSQLELSELALGLELSGVPFLWALRNNSCVLPGGFEERVQGRGVVWKSWAPQLNILSHESIGGFLTHCGWSSAVEGLMFGHPLIMLPFFIDTGLIARIMEEKQVGIEIPRNEVNGSYTRDSVADSVRLIMVENEGKIYQDKAKEISAIFGDRKLHDGYIQKFVDYLEKNRQKSKSEDI